MKKVNIKKLLFLTIGLIVLLVFGIRLVDPSVSAGQPENSDSDIDNAYFTLFQKFKELPPTNMHFKTRKLTGVPVLRRDPFVRPDAIASAKTLLSSGEPLSEGALKLSGILWDNESPSAVINGEVAQVGYKLGQFRVTRIQKTQVSLLSPQGKITLHLPEDEDIE